MSIPALVPAIVPPGAPERGKLSPRAKRVDRTPPTFHAAAQVLTQNQFADSSYRQAELFYLQKQIQAQTPMVIVLEDGEHIEGCIEWYDRNTLKVRGRQKTLVYKSAIKYMYKLGDNG